MDKKITFHELSTPLKIGIILSYVFGGFWLFVFTLGMIAGVI